MSDRGVLPNHGAELNRDYYWRGIRVPSYRTPLAQVALVGFIAFCTVGMSSALGGAGGGGLLNTTQSTNANVAVYSTFAALAFFGGTIYNRVGIKICLAFGGLGYACLASAYFTAAHLGDRATGWIVAAGCLEGLSAAMLWTAQGAVTMCYPEEKMKGRAFSLFWTIFQMGGVIGSIIPLGLSWNSAPGNASDGVYITFITVMLVGCTLPLLLLPSNQVIRADGTRVVIPEMPTWKSEIRGMLETVRANWWIITLFPYFAASNWFYTYQQNDFNASNFTLRTRYFNGLWSNFFNMMGVLFMGTALDFPFKGDKITRQTRARAGLLFIFISAMSIWGGGWSFAKDSVRGVKPDPLIDMTESSRYARYLIIYIAYSFFDGCFQCYIYWLMGALSNNSQTLSHFAGWYKSIQSAAAAVVWRLDGIGTAYTTMFLSTWGLLGGSVVCAVYVVFMKVQQHSPDEPQVLVNPQELGLAVENVETGFSESEETKKKPFSKHHPLRAPINCRGHLILNGY